LNKRHKVDARPFHAQGEALMSLVRIIEVGPRDGLQNEKNLAPAALKIDLVLRLAAAGLRTVEAGAFVSPAWVPQMADSDRVLRALPSISGVSFPVLVPNAKGYAAARQAGAKEIAIFGAASESFSQRNINCSIEESFQRFEPVVQTALADGVKVRGYVSCVLDCPYEGPTDCGKVAAIAARMAAMGCYEISLGDTIGTGTPKRAATMLRRVAADVPLSALALHFHDTYGQALANILACLEEGAGAFDSAVAGLGGCPYARGASGNVATEDLVYMLEGLGLSTGVDLAALAAIGAWISHELGRPHGSKAGQAIEAKRKG
jgi:hydroxymethylglutaryl-CoA lyase